MSYHFNLPNITATTPEGKLAQMQSFLYQTVEQLNWALNALETGAGTDGTYAKATSGSGNTENSKDSVSNFNEIKALIIKSADIVEAYYEQISKKLSGEYVAKSDFGTYKEKTDAVISANSKGITQQYTNLQQINSDVSYLLEANAYIKTGEIDYDEFGAPVYGLEIGQSTEIDDVEVFKKYARFTADRLSFYDQNNYEVAYVSDKKLHITHIEVIEENSTFTLGNLTDTVLADGSVVTR